MNNITKILPQKLRNYIWNEVKCGLKKDKNLHKDFSLGLFWGSSYKPLHIRTNNKVISIKNQNGHNTCGQESKTGSKEIQEGVELSEQFQTIMMKKMGSISHDGYSSLKGNLNCVKEYGICEKILLNMGHAVGWDKYSNYGNITPKMLANALLHRIQSYFSVNSRGLKLKALDKGKVIYTGMNWYSGFNASGGYKSGQVIDRHLGGYVGGHAVYILNYDLEKECSITGVLGKVYELANSYSKSYGYQGLFYVSMDYFDKFGHAGYVEVDMPEDLAKFLKEFEGEYVKTHNNGGAIWKIVNGKKRPFPDSETYIFCSGKWGDQKGYRYVDDEFPDGKALLEQVRNDFDMAVYDADVMDIIKKYPKEFKALLSSEHLQEEVLKRI